MRSAVDALLVDDATGRVDDVRVTLVHRQQHVRVAGLVAAVGLDRVVQAQHRRRRAALDDAAHGVESDGERRERERGADLRRRQRVQSQSRADDDAERSFRTDEELGEIRTDRGTRRAAGGHDAAVGEHDVEADDDVFDLAVAGRELAGAAAREPAADRRERHRLRPVPARDVVPAAKLVFEHVAERARLHVDEHRRVVDVDDAVDRGEVEQHAAEHRNARAAHAAAAGGGGDRNARFVAQPQARPRPRRWSAGRTITDARAVDLIVERPDHRERPPVAARLADLGGCVDTSAPVAASRARSSSSTSTRAA